MSILGPHPGCLNGQCSLYLSHIGVQIPPYTTHMPFLGFPLVTRARARIHIHPRDRVDPEDGGVGGERPTHASGWVPALAGPKEPEGLPLRQQGREAEGPQRPRRGSHAQAWYLRPRAYLHVVYPTSLDPT